MEQAPKKTVRLPFEFGDVVFHRARAERIAGLVTGFHVRPHGVLIQVTWGHDLSDMLHHFCELTTEFQPDFSSES